jgi:galactitol-specific phosphotransferase system IIB component
LTKTAPLLASVALLAACGRAIATSSVSESQLAPPDALQCVMKQFDQLGFQRTMYDKDELRTSARKVNPKITFSNVQFRKTWDRLEVQVRTGTKGTDVNVTATTVAEYFSQNALNYNYLPPTDEVKQAAQMLQQACSAAASPPASPTPASQP